MSTSPTLFRSEVLAERRAQWLGPVLLVPKASHRGFAAFAVTATVAILALLVFGTYPRKVRINGSIVPQGGLVQVFPRQAGVVTDVFVQEGTHVNQGDRLATISADLQSTAMGGTGEHVARQLTSRKESLLEDRRNLERLAEQQKRSLADRLAALESSEGKIGSEIALQGARVKSAERSVARQQALSKEGLASGEHVQTAEEGQIEQTAKLRALESNQSITARDRITVQGEIDDLPLKLQRDIASVDRNIALLEEELAELAARREIVLVAPQTGIVTATQIKRGGQPDPKLPLLAIVPDGAKLEASLLCSSQAVGFLKAGQRVLLRYAAFPYQKFGHYEGTVSGISQSAVSPAELGPQAASLAEPGGANEPLYRVTVTLARQAVQAYGNEVPLQPGMQLEADVVLEKRRLVEWMLEPLFTVSGTWKR